MGAGSYQNTGNNCSYDLLPKIEISNINIQILLVFVMDLTIFLNSQNLYLCHRKS